MSDFNPSSAAFDPPDLPELLPAALVMALSRPVARKLAWNLPRMCLAALTGGLLPLPLLSRRFANFAAGESQHLLHLAQWLGLDSADPEPAQLLPLARFDRPRRHAAAVWLLTGLAAVAAVRFFALQNVSLYGWIDLLTSGAWTRHTGGDLPAGALHAARLFAAAIGAASLVWLWQVRDRAAQVRRYAQTLNRVLARRGLRPVRIGSTSWGLRPVWVAAGLIFCGAGAVWALPMFVAAAAHRDYMLRQSYPLRMALSQRVRQILYRRRPAVFVPTPPLPLERCAASRCRAKRPIGALHCPRCGAAAA